MSSLQPRFPATASAALEPVSTSAEAMRQRSTSSSIGKDTRARDLLDSSMGEKSLATDPKTRKDWAKFTQLVDRTLQSFDSVSEWADFITFLGKLLKCLQSYPNFAYIPHKLIVAKRLAQCLNPALPTGVHQRALDVYVHILNAIGPEGLKKDLQLWSSGLFPFFQYAATSVRPIVLGIYSKFYLQLQDALRPAMKSLILALLPGLDEETGEFFDKVASLMDQLSGTVAPSFFLQNIWLVLITAPSLRIAALNYLGRRMPKIGTEDSISLIVGEDVGLMVRGFSETLEDSQILVQRAALDLVASSLRLDGAGFQKDTRHQDQLILVRAMTGVVLRRDLSLSRRLYGWLLGPAEDSETQIAYFKQHGLGLLRQALVVELLETSAAGEDTVVKQRPFKVLQSLLDKWEISYPLTEVIVSDVLRSLDRFSREGELHDELLITASMLFDGLDPFLTWRHLFLTARHQLTTKTGGQRDALDLIAFVIHAFRLSEDEIVKLHAPLVAFGILDLVYAARQETDSQSKDDAAEDHLLALNISHALLKETSRSFFTSSESQDDSASLSHCGISVASNFYSEADNKSARLPTTGFAARLLSNAYSVLLDLSVILAEGTSPNKARIFMAAQNLLVFLAEQPNKDQAVVVSWDPQAWLHRFSEALADSVLSFEEFEVGVQCLVALQAAPITPRLELDQRRNMDGIIQKLLSFLAPKYSSKHVQAVSLFWALQEAIGGQHVEATVCQQLSSNDYESRQAAFEAFGNLWRFSDDAHLPGVKLSMAMRIMLDALQSNDLSIRRAGEAWMRCSLKSYVRILDPLCCVLLDPKIRRKSTIVQIDDRSVTLNEYEKIFDLSQHYHILENLLSLASFGGQGFTRLAKSSYVKASYYTTLQKRAQIANMDNDNYLEMVCKILVQILLSDPASSLRPSIGPMNTKLHAISADLLQVVISRGDLDLTTLQSIEHALAVRLHLLISRSEHDLQNKLLHVLHSAIAAIATHQKRTERKSLANEQAHRPSLESMGVHTPLLVKLLCNGICEQRNSALIHHWVDFLLMTISHFRNALHTLLLPLIDALSARVAAFVEEFQAAFDPVRKGKGPSNGINDADHTILLNALERLFAMALDEAKAAEASEDESVASERPQTAMEGGGVGLLGYISTALGAADGSVTHIAGSSSVSKHNVKGRLAEFVQLLLSGWHASSRLEALSDYDENTSLNHTAEHMKSRTKKAFERLYKTSPLEVFEGIITAWAFDRQGQTVEERYEREDRLFEMLHHLSPNAQTVVTMLSDIISRQPGQEKGKTSAAVPTDYEITLFEYLEAFMDRQDGAVAVTIWSSFLNFSKDFINTPAVHKYRLLPTLRCFIALAEKISQTPALEDRRLRRELLENFVKLVDATVQMSGRSGSGLQRPSNNHLSASANKEGESTAPTTPMEGPGKESLERSILSEKGSSSNARASDSAKELAEFLAKRIIPNFRRFNIDNDKLAASCANIMYYNVAPAFKTRTRSFDVDDAVLELLAELTRVPAALKAWRTQVLEVYNDNRFFYGGPSTAQKWQTIVQALITSDKERFPELVHRISTTVSSAANIFVNRELESLSKSMSIRRLSYTIYCAEKNRYLTQLPSIQEKVVELLRANVSDMVHSEVYLCLRVLLCRIGNQHLASFWPVILSELLRLFETLMNDPSAQSTEYLQLILSACKFLDLSLVLQTEEFQIHQWMFITDTVDAVYPPESWSPQATMDRLGEILNSRHDLQLSTPGPRASISLLNTKAGPHTQAGQPGTAAPMTSVVAPPLVRGTSATGQPDVNETAMQDPNSEDDLADGVTLRKAKIKPLLSGIRQSKITSLGALEPFFSRASLANYEAVYSLGTVDWAAVERSLAADLFEGDD